MNKGITVLRPLLVAAGVEEKGTVILGTVKGDLHDIGKIGPHDDGGQGLKVGPGRGRACPAFVKLPRSTVPR
ncbi:MAG: hypothetical protein ACLTYN_03965 [Dysosmobacter welbionis]